MISLEEFEGISGYRWGAYINSDDQLSLSEDAPTGSEKKINFVKKLLAMAHAPINQADLIFEHGKVIIRQGDYGLLLLFCETSMNTTMLGLVLSDMERDIKKVSDSINAMCSSTGNIMHGTEDSAPSVPPEVISALMRLFVEFLGPLAPALACKEAEAAQLDLDHLHPEKWTRLLEVLGARITDKEKHEQFLDRAVMLKTNHK